MVLVSLSGSKRNQELSQLNPYYLRRNIIMIKRIYNVILLIALLFTAISCDQSVKSATFNIQNNSQYPVTDFFTDSFGNKCYREILEPGKQCSLMYEWVESPTRYAMIEFTMNGEKYGSLYAEQLDADTTGRYKPLKQILIGETVTVKIYDDHWEW